MFEFANVNANTNHRDILLSLMECVGQPRSLDHKNRVQITNSQCPLVGKTHLTHQYLGIRCGEILLEVVKAKGIKYSNSHIQSLQITNIVINHGLMVERKELYIVRFIG